MTKIRLTATIIALFVTVGVFGQVGIKLGVGATKFVNAYDDIEQIKDLKNNPLIVPVAGLMFDLGLSNMFTIQPELYFVQKGHKTSYNYGVDNIKTDLDFRLNTIELPILLKLQFGNPQKDAVGFNIVAGPYGSFFINGKLNQITTTPNSVEVKEVTKIKFDDEDGYKERFDFGLMGGVGVSFGHFVIDGRYSYGLKKVLSNDTEINPSDGFRTSTFYLTVGYFF